MKTPRVSLVVPCFRRPQRTLRMLRCISKQTINEFELFFIGDGCLDFYELSQTEEFKDIMESLKQRGVVVNSFSMDRHGGFGYAIINYALENATGKYFMFASNDDIIEPDHLEFYLSEIENTDYSMVCYSTLVYFPNPSVRIPKLEMNKIGHSELIVETSKAKNAPKHGPQYGHDWVFISHFLESEYKVKISDNLNKQTYTVMGSGGNNIKVEDLD